MRRVASWRRYLAEAILVALCAADAVVLLGLSPSMLPAGRAVGLLIVHVASAIGTGACLLSIFGAETTPEHARGAAGLGTCLMGFVPVVGALGFYVAVRVGTRATHRPVARPWTRIGIDPDWEDPTWSPRSRERAINMGPLKDLLSDRSPELAVRRFQGLQTVKHMKGQVRVPLLKIALRDPSDEVRLFAFSMIAQMRDELEQSIRLFRLALSHAENDETRAHAHLRLGEAHWEMTYLGLADKAVFHHVLGTALAHATKSIELGPSASAMFLSGRIFLAMENIAAASEAFRRALDAGHPSSKVLPYLAECAFRARDFARVRIDLSDLRAAARGNAPLLRVLEFWL